MTLSLSPLPLRYYQVLSCITIPSLSNSDHYNIQLILSAKAPNRWKNPLLRKIWRYSHANFDAISDSINDVNWDLFLSVDVDTSVANWKTCFMDIMCNYIPYFSVKPNNRVPWINKAIIQAMHKRISFLLRQAIWKAL